MYAIRNARTRELLGTAETLHDANEWSNEYMRKHWEIETAIYDQRDNEIIGPEDVEDYVGWLQDIKNATKPLTHDEALQMFRKLADQQRADMPEWVPEIPYGMDCGVLQRVWNEAFKEG